MMNNAVVKSDVVTLPPVVDTGFSLSDFRQAIYRRWKPALAVGVIAFGVVLIPELLKTPQYKSETKILLNSPQNKQSADVSLNSGNPVADYYNLQDLSTDILVLRSNNLIQKALKKYPEKFGSLSVGEVRSRLSLNPAVVNDIPTDVLSISYIDSDPARARSILEALGEVYVDYSLQRERSQAFNAIKFIAEQLPNAEKELNEAAFAIRRFRQENNLVDPNQYAEQVAEFRQSLDQKSKEVEISFSTVQSKYQAISRQLIQLGQDPETILASSVLGQDGVYQNVANQLKDLETQYALGSVSFYDSYPQMQDLKLKREQLRNLLQERAKQILGEGVSQAVLDRVLINATQPEVLTTPDSGTQVSTSGSTLEQLTGELLASQIEFTTLNTQLTGILNAKTKVEVDFQRLPQLQEIYTRLQRDLEIKSNAVNYLLTRRQELQISAAEETAPWQILDEAYLPGKPISPNVQNAITRSLFIGGFLGLLTVWLLQQLDNNVKLVEEVKHLTNLPLLGAVPKVTDPRIIIEDKTVKDSYSYRYSSFTESLRAVAMNISYTIVDTGKIKSLVTTSSTSSEGKTTVTYNLGLAMTELGSRVLIVDADLRKPKMHKMAHIDNDKGLSEILANNEPWSELKHSTSNDLDVITAGANVANPIGLLRSPRMSELIEEWEEQYDYVLIDTPPIGVMADAQSLVHQVDSVMIITGINRVSQKAVCNTLEVLQGTNCNLIGFVANLVEKDLDYYSYSYYSHYYNQASSEGNGNGNGNGNGHSKVGSIMQQFRRR